MNFKNPSRGSFLYKTKLTRYSTPHITETHFDHLLLFGKGKYARVVVVGQKKDVWSTKHYRNQTFPRERVR